MPYYFGNSLIDLMITESLNCIIFCCVGFNFMLFCPSWFLNTQNPLLMLLVRDYVKSLAWKRN